MHVRGLCICSIVLPVKRDGLVQTSLSMKMASYLNIITDNGSKSNQHGVPSCETRRSCGQGSTGTHISNGFVNQVTVHNASMRAAIRTSCDRCSLSLSAFGRSPMGLSAGQWARLNSEVGLGAPRKWLPGAVACTCCYNIHKCWSRCLHILCFVQVSTYPQLLMCWLVNQGTAIPGPATMRSRHL
jgi:hypothetical protein